MPYPRFDVGMAMLEASSSPLFAVERFKDLPPDPSQFGYHGDFEALGHLRDILLRHQRKLLDPQRTLDALRQAFVDCLVDITRQLPPLARDDGSEELNATDGHTRSYRPPSQRRVHHRIRDSSISTRRKPRTCACSTT